MLYTLVGYALGALMGMSLGLMGGGGSILTVPIFVYALGFDPKLAIAMSLPVVGGTSLIGAAGHWRAGNVDLRTAAIFGALAMVGAYFGARLATYFTGAQQLVLLAIVMLAAAGTMFRSAARERPADVPAPPAEPMKLSLVIPAALGVGVLTGLVGIGGGFLVVPALVLLAGVPIKRAVGTSLLVIAMNSVSGYAGYAGQVDVPWTFVAGFMVVSAIGILIGTRLVHFVSPRALKRGFAVFLVLVGAFVLYRNQSRLRGGEAHATTSGVTVPSATTRSPA